MPNVVSNSVESLSNCSNPLECQPNGVDSDNSADITMPSVKDLVNKFATKEDNDTVPKLVDVKRKSSFSDSKLSMTNGNGNNNPKNAASWHNNQSNFKVNSVPFLLIIVDSICLIFV